MVRRAVAPADTGARLPGYYCDAAEAYKHNKHYASVVASDRRNAFTPVTVNEYGQIGPQAVDLVDLIASRAHDPVTLKTYTMRRLAVGGSSSGSGSGGGDCATCTGGQEVCSETCTRRFIDMCINTKGFTYAQCR